MRVAPLSIALALSAAACGPLPSDAELDGANVRSSEQALSNAASSAPSPLTDRGGLILPAAKTWAIYWGPPADFPADLQPGMASLLTGLNSSSYLAIAKQYMRGAAISTQYMGAVSDPTAPPRSAPNANALGAEVCRFFPSPDPNGLYIVFTSNTPNINYCAWHNKTTCNGVPIQVAYIPNQAGLPGCSPYTRSNLGCNTYSNGTVTAADSVAHEFMEAITDPRIDAWLDANKWEIADKCNYTYSACVGLSDGSSWQIQAEWSNAIAGCQQQ